MLAAAKAKPKTISSASADSGTSQHMTLELLAFKTGTQFIHVPYKGSGPAIQNVIGGQVELKSLGMQSSSMTPEQVSAFQKAEVEKWAQVFKAAGIKLE